MTIFSKKHLLLIAGIIVTLFILICLWMAYPKYPEGTVIYGEWVEQDSYTNNYKSNYYRFSKTAGNLNYQTSINYQGSTIVFHENIPFIGHTVYLAPSDRFTSEIRIKATYGKAVSFGILPSYKWQPEIQHRIKIEKEP